MKEMNIQFHKTRPQNPFDDGAKARLHRMGLLRIDGSVDEATLDALSRAYSGLLFDDLCDTCQNSCEITEILRRLYEAAEQAEPRQKFLLICRNTTRSLSRFPIQFGGSAVIRSLPGTLQSVLSAI